MLLDSIERGLRIARQPLVTMIVGRDEASGMDDAADLRAVLDELYALRAKQEPDK
jgi:hypothetical protein